MRHVDGVNSVEMRLIGALKQSSAYHRCYSAAIHLRHRRHRQWSEGFPVIDVRVLYFLSADAVSSHSSLTIYHGRSKRSGIAVPYTAHGNSCAISARLGIKYTGGSSVVEHQVAYD